jgi:hypothetical protein
MAKSQAIQTPTTLGRIGRRNVVLAYMPGMEKELPLAWPPVSLPVLPVSGSDWCQVSAGECLMEQLTVVRSYWVT